MTNSVFISFYYSRNISGMLLSHKEKANQMKETNLQARTCSLWFCTLLTCPPDLCYDWSQHQKTILKYFRVCGFLSLMVKALQYNNAY